MKGLAISAVLALANLLLVAVLYGQIGTGLANAIQFVVIPLLVVATVGFAVKDFLRRRTRFQSVVALVLSVPIVFMYFVWHGWIVP